MTRLGWGFSNSGGIWGNVGYCVCVLVAVVCVVLGESGVGGLGQSLGGWGSVMSGVCCESRLSVLMAGPGICILC